MPKQAEVAQLSCELKISPMMRYLSLVVICGSLLLASCKSQTRAVAAEPNLIPWPKSLKTEQGSLALTDKSRIVFKDDALMPLANILSDELFEITGQRIPAARGEGSSGDILLQVDKSLSGEEHKVVIGDNATISGGNYVGVCMGTAVVLQSVNAGPNGVSLPYMTLRDKPYPQYTGMMLDVARQFNSIDVLKQCVELARLYKMKYFHLHLTDDQIFTFPSTKYPKLKGVYTLDELKGLVKYADDRGVTIIPEFEMPGHSSALAAPYSDIFGDTQGCVINFINPPALPMLADIVNEMCDVFQSSPYFHMGSDESNFVLFETWPDVVADRAKNHRGTAEQHAWLINEIDKVVKARGKQLIVWEGFSSPIVNKDVIVMEWDGRYFSPIPITQAGYKVINVPWVPSIANTGSENYDQWNLWQLGSQEREPDQFKPTTNPADDPVIGGQMVFWEHGGDDALPNLRGTGVARHERIHSPFAGKTFADFDRRFAYTDRVLDLLVHHFSVAAEGLTSHTDHFFDKTATLTMTLSPAEQDKEIHYTLDEKPPTATSAVYSAPIQLTQTTTVKAQLFDKTGKAAGFPRSLKYFLKPLSAKTTGLISSTLRTRKFSDPITVTIQSALPGNVRYTLDESDPTAKSPIYDQPLRIEKTTTIKAQLFGVDGKALGDPWRDSYTWVNYQKNLATGKPVTASSFDPSYPPENATDGLVELERAWWAGPYPQWLQVDLQKVTKLDHVQVFPYWDGQRYYQYDIAVSEDGKNWTRVVDMRNNTKIATEAGDMHQFPAVSARYVRVNVLKNSANEGVHLVEVRVF